MPDPIKLPPGAQLVDSGGGMKLPPGASLVGDAVPSADPTPGSAQDVAAKLAGTKLPPLAPSVMDTLGEGITPPTTLGGAITSAVKEGIYHPQGFQAVRNILNLGNQAAKGQNENVKAMGERGDLSPTATGLLSLPSGVAESATRIGAGMSSPGNATLAAASLHPALRLPVAAYGAVTGGKAMLDSADNLSDPAKLEQFLLGGSGVAGSAALGASAKLPTPSNLRYPNGPPLAPEAAVSRLRTAVNPTAADAPGFVRNLTEQINEVAAHQSGTAPTDLPSLAKHLESTAAADPYQATLIKPHADVSVSPRQIAGYGGKVDPTGNTTIGALDQRLTTINKTLSPAYSRGPAGSAQQVAAVGAEQAQALQAEAAQIRNTLATELSKRTGLPPEQIAAARRNYGQLNDLRDTVQYYADEAAHKANVAAAAPPDLHTTVAGLAKGGAQKLIRAVQDRTSSPRSPNAIIDQTFQRFKGNARPPLAPVAPTVTPPRATPAWQNGGNPTTTIPPQVAALQPPSAPAIPAAEPGLLRPAGGTATSSTPLPFGPTAASAPAGEVAARGMTVGDEHPEISLYPDAIESVLKTGSLKSGQLGLPPASSIQLGPSSIPPQVLDAIGERPTSAAKPPLAPLSNVRTPAERAAIRVQYTGPERRVTPRSHIPVGEKENVPYPDASDPAHAAELAAVQDRLANGLRLPEWQRGLGETPEGKIRMAGLVSKGEVSPGSGVYQFEDPAHPGKTASMRLADIQSGGAAAIKAKMESKLAEMRGVGTPQQVAHPLEPRVATIDVHGTHSAPGTHGTVPASQVAEAVRHGHRIVGPLPGEGK